MIQLVALMGYMEVANDNIAVLLFTCRLIIKSYYSIKLTRSNLFRVYFTNRKYLGGGGGGGGRGGGGGGLMERYLREVIDD